MSAGYLRPSEWTDLDSAGNPEAVYIAGGTEVLPLMRAGVLQPEMLIDLSRVGDADIHVPRPGLLEIGALARLTDVARNPLVRSHAPAIADALRLGASAQIRNMATIGGNLLQRTRCGYFRDSAFPCNKRNLGSGCPAQQGLNRQHSLFGGSPHCVAAHPSDLAVVLMAMDATVWTRHPGGASCSISIHDLYRLPADRPDLDTSLLPGDVITHIHVPFVPAVRSTFLKVRERALFDFALVSVAISLRWEAKRIAEVRIALGGVAPRPWRLRDIERRLIGVTPTSARVRTAFATIEHHARPLQYNAFKIALAQNLAIRCLGNLARDRSVSATPKRR